MRLKEVILFLLLGYAVAGPVSQNRAQCSQECPGDSKFQYSEKKSYVYSYEATNSISKRQPQADLSTVLKATIEITPISKCDMILQILDVSVKHGTVLDASSSFADALKKNSLLFAWQDGIISNICPDPSDPEDIVNIKRGMLSTMQNTMKTLSHDSVIRETDVLGSCHTEYKVKEQKGDEYRIEKMKTLSSCSNYVHGRAGSSATPYESQSSLYQHIPLFFDGKSKCNHLINGGIIQEIVCVDSSLFHPGGIADIKVKVEGDVKLQLITTKDSQPKSVGPNPKKDLVYEYEPQHHEVQEKDGTDAVTKLCEQSKTLLKEDIGKTVNNLVHVIRGMSPSSVKKLYESLKNNELCNSPIVQGIFLDVLKAAASEGAYQVLSELAVNKELSYAELMLWLAGMPFASDPHEGAISASVPLLSKDFGSKQALLSVSAMAHKYCETHSDCESKPSVQSVISALQNYLHDDCKTSSDTEEEEVITALKAFGNLGFVGSAKETIVKCAEKEENSIPVRIAALEAFRRSPCKDSTSSELLKFYDNTNENDEIRIASLMVLSRCPSPAIIYRIYKTYSAEKSKQVMVYTWSYLNNIKETSDPTKVKAKLAASKLKLEHPDSTDITKFSRNFEISSFSEILNVGYGVEANVIHSQSSFLPRSGNLDFKVDLFGYQFDLLEFGLRMENIENKLEDFLGPEGSIKKYFNKNHSHYPDPADSTADVYKARIKALKEKVNMEHSHDPKGALYIRIMGNELRWRPVKASNIKDLTDIDPDKIISKIMKYRSTTNGHSFIFLDQTLLVPSITGRAYKLNGNGSITVTMQTDGKMDVLGSTLKDFHFLLDKRYQPSATVQFEGALSIHSEDYEPAVKVKTNANFAHDAEIKLEVKKGPSIDAKIKFPQEKMKIFSLKRSFYEVDINGEKEMPKPSQMTDLSYCTRTLDRLFGVKFCGHIEMPKPFDKQGGLYFGPWPIEAHVERTQTDKSITDYEFTLHVPESRSSEIQEYKLGFDTPNSSTNRKFLSELIIHYPDKYTRTSKFKFTSPFYDLEYDTSFVSSPQKLEIAVDVLGNHKRKYTASLSVDIDIRGARLAEYKPTLTIAFPGIDPVRFYGTIVSARGRKQQLSFDIKSDSFLNHPLSFKGNVAREGTFFNPESEVQILSEITAEMLAKKYKLYSTYKRIGLQANLDVGLDYVPEDKGVQSVKLKTMLSDFSLHPLSYNLESQLLMSEYPQYNAKINWDFSSKFLQHQKSNIIIHYGKDFHDEKRMIQIMQINVLEGDFISLDHVDFENKIVIVAPMLNIDSSAAFSIAWDLVHKPKFLVDIGIRAKPEKEISLHFNLESLNGYGQRPIKLNTEMKFVFLNYKFNLRDNIEETSSNLLQGRAIIQPNSGKQITVDHTYAIRSTDQIFYHEFECTIVSPDRAVPIQQKLYVKRSRGSVEFGSRTDIGNQSPYVIDAKINRAGPSELTISLPILDGKLTFTEQDSTTTFNADIRILGQREDRRIIAIGKFTRGNPDQLDMEISWDADRNAKQKVVLTGKSYLESPGRRLTASVNYADSINVEISGSLGDPLKYGPHQIRADFSGHMEPMSIVLSYEVVGGELKGAVKYLRNNVEKVRADITGKFIYRAYQLAIEGGAKVTSPYKAFDGKEIYAGLLMDSNESTRNFLAEYRLRRNPVLGYTAKLEYKRKRGFPGNVKSKFEVTVHRRPLYEANMNLEYGGGKYFFKSTIMPPSNKKFHSDTTMEISAKYATFHHSLVTTFQHLQLLRVNAIADLRNTEDYKVQTDFEVNEHKVYDFNATLSSRSITDFEGSILLVGKIVPSLHVYSKAHNANSLTKYSLTVEKNSNEILSGKGEIRKRKRGFNGNLVFNYKGGDILTVELNNEVKSQRERNYVIKLESMSRTYTISIHSQKEKKGNKVSVSVCRNQNDKCVTVGVTHKDDDNKHEYLVTYQRGDVELNFDRIYAHSDHKTRRYFVIHSGGRKFGYDLEYGKQDDKTSASIGFIFPAREIKFGTAMTLSQKEPEIQLTIQADARNHPDRKLQIDAKIDNQLSTDRPSEIQMKITHPMYEKPLEIRSSANLDLSKAKFLEGKMSFDFSTNPEDKIISKFYLEKDQVPHGGFALRMNVDVYHKDEEHLDFMMKHNISCHDGLFEKYDEMRWKDENNEDKHAFASIKYDSNIDKFDFVYHRPTIDISIAAKAVSLEKLHGDEYVVDFDIYYNEAHIKAKLSHNYQTNCRKFDIFDDKGTVIRTVEMCVNIRNPVLFSLTTMSIEDDMWVFDYSFEVIRKSFGTLNIRHHWNPEFLGAVVFQMTQFGSELAEAGIGTMPMAGSPVYKQLIKSFKEKVGKPTIQFITEEAKKMYQEFLVELRFYKDKVRHYYNQLPSSEEVLEFIKSLKPLLKKLCDEIKHIFELLLDDFKRLYKDLLDRTKELRDKLRDRCSKCPECLHTLEAIEQRSYLPLLEVVKSMISRLPPEVQEYVRRGGKIEQFLKQIHDIINTYLEQHSEEIEKLLDMIREAHHNFRRIYGKYSVMFWRAYKAMLRDVQDSEFFKKALAFYKEKGQQILQDIKDLKFESLVKLAKELFGEFLIRFQLPSLRSFFKINELDSERGVLDIEIYFYLNYLTPTFISNQLYWIYSKIHDMVQVSSQYNLKTLLALLKRTSDLNIVPPYKEQAIILGQQHYITFDKTFYDFAGECTYLMATDLVDGNFSIIITPTFSLSDGDSGSREPSIGVIVGKSAVLINLKTRYVKYGSKLVDLPLIAEEDLMVTRDGHVITVDDHHGLHVECHVVYDVCTISISGWYYGKTAGLLGTYNYEPADDFKRPRGQIPNSVTTFAKSWDLNKGCKTKNLVPDTKIDHKSDVYTLCAEVFSKSDSHLSACFKTVDPKEFLTLCYKYLKEEGDKKKALCAVATAYVSECEHNYVELDLPPSCLTCPTPNNGTPLKHGERKQFSNLESKAADVIFVVELSRCNEHLLQNLNDIARSVDRELINEGLQDNMFGLVTFDSSGHDPLIKASKGNILFSVNDLPQITNPEHYLTSNSTMALEALRVAVTYPFRIDASRTLVLMTCSRCEYNYKSLQYPVIQQILLEHDIVLHTIGNQNLRLRKLASMEKQIIGADADTVYHIKDVTQKELTGEPELRSQVALPKDACAALAQDVDGSYFTTHSFKNNEVSKGWRSIFARRVLKSAVRTSPCYICDCTSTADHVAKVDCQPCKVRRPRLPFSVCKSCAYPTPLMTLYSYFLSSIL